MVCVLDMGLPKEATHVRIITVLNSMSTSACNSITKQLPHAQMTHAFCPQADLTWREWWAWGPCPSFEWHVVPKPTIQYRFLRHRRTAARWVCPRPASPHPESKSSTGPPKDQWHYCRTDKSNRSHIQRKGSKFTYALSHRLDKNNQ